jgi:hypothetical protein
MYAGVMRAIRNGMVAARDGALALGRNLKGQC